MENKNNDASIDWILKIKKIWAYIEFPVAILALIAALGVSIFAIMTFNTKSISVNQLSHLYSTNLKSVELVGLALNLARNLIIWISINLLGNNVVFAAIALLLTSRILAIPFTNKSMHSVAKQGVLKLEYFKLKKFYAKAAEDPEVKQMYTQDSMRLPKKFGIVSTEHIAGQMLSTIPMIIVSWGSSLLLTDLRLNVHDLTVGGIPITKPFIPFAILTAILMILQQILPLKNAHGPTADQQKQMALFMPVILMFVFMNQPAIIPMVWSVSYLVTLVPMLYYYRIKKFNRMDVLNRP